MLANLDERIKDKILIQYYNTCVIYDFKNAEYRSVLTLFFNSWSVLVCRKFSDSKFQSCGPVIEKEFLTNEVHLNFGISIRRFVLFDLQLYRVLFLKVSMSVRYEGAMPCNALQTSIIT